MRIEWGEHSVTLRREPDDPRYHGVRNAAGESRLLYALRNTLREAGYDVIKKRMWRDGHMVDDLQQYVRTRSKRAGFMIYNGRFMIEGAERAWNEDGYVRLCVARYGPDC